MCAYRIPGRDTGGGADETVSRAMRKRLGGATWPSREDSSRQHRPREYPSFDVADPDEGLLSWPRSESSHQGYKSSASKKHSDSYHNYDARTQIKYTTHRKEGRLTTTRWDNDDRDDVYNRLSKSDQSREYEAPNNRTTITKTFDYGHGGVGVVAASSENKAAESAVIHASSSAGGRCGYSDELYPPKHPPAAILGALNELNLLNALSAKQSALPANMDLPIGGATVAALPGSGLLSPATSQLNVAAAQTAMDSYEKMKQQFLERIGKGTSTSTAAPTHVTQASNSAPQTSVAADQQWNIIDGASSGIDGWRDSNILPKSDASAWTQPASSTLSLTTPPESQGKSLPVPTNTADLKTLAATLKSQLGAPQGYFPPRKDKTAKAKGGVLFNRSSGTTIPGLGGEPSQKRKKVADNKLTFLSELVTEPEPISLTPQVPVTEGENGAQSVEQSSKFPRKKWLGTAGIPKTHLMRSEKPNLTEVCVSCSEDGLTFKNKKELLMHLHGLEHVLMQLGLHKNRLILQKLKYKKDENQIDNNLICKVCPTYKAVSAGELHSHYEGFPHIVTMIRRLGRIHFRDGMSHLARHLGRQKAPPVAHYCKCCDMSFPFDQAEKVWLSHMCQPKHIKRFLRLKWDSEEIEIMKKKMMELVVEDFNSDIVNKKSDNEDKDEDEDLEFILAIEMEDEDDEPMKPITTQAPHIVPAPVPASVPKARVQRVEPAAAAAVFTSSSLPRVGAKSIPVLSTSNRIVKSQSSVSPNTQTPPIMGVPSQSIPVLHPGSVGGPPPVPVSGAMPMSGYDPRGIPPGVAGPMMMPYNGASRPGYMGHPYPQPQGMMPLPFNPFAFPPPPLPPAVNIPMQQPPPQPMNNWARGPDVLPPGVGPVNLPPPPPGVSPVNPPGGFDSGKDQIEKYLRDERARNDDEQSRRRERDRRSEDRNRERRSEEDRSDRDRRHASPSHSKSSSREVRYRDSADKDQRDSRRSWERDSRRSEGRGEKEKREGGRPEGEYREDINRDYYAKEKQQKRSNLEGRETERQGSHPRRENPQESRETERGSDLRRVILRDRESEHSTEERHRSRSHHEREGSHLNQERPRDDRRPENRDYDHHGHAYKDDKRNSSHERERRSRSKSSAEYRHDSYDGEVGYSRSREGGQDRNDRDRDRSRPGDVDDRGPSFKHGHRDWRGEPGSSTRPPAQLDNSDMLKLQVGDEHADALQMAMNALTEAIVTYQKHVEQGLETPTLDSLNAVENDMAQSLLQRTGIQEEGVIVIAVKTLMRLDPDLLAKISSLEVAPLADNLDDEELIKTIAMGDLRALEQLHPKILQAVLEKDTEVLDTVNANLVHVLNMQDPHSIAKCLDLRQKEEVKKERAREASEKVTPEIMKALWTKSKRSLYHLEPIIFEGYLHQDQVILKNVNPRIIQCLERLHVGMVRTVFRDIKEELRRQGKRPYEGDSGRVDEEYIADDPHYKRPRY